MDRPHVIRMVPSTTKGFEDIEYLSSGSWPDPEPLDEPVAAVPFDLDLCIPKTMTEFRSLVVGFADTYQVPVDLPVMLAMPIASMAMSKLVEIRPVGDWVEGPNLYTVSILASGERKSPVLAKLLAPVEEWQREEEERYRTRLPTLKNRVEILRRRLKDAQKSAAQDDGPSAESDEIAEALAKAERQLSSPPCLVVTEGTAEGIFAALRANRERALVASAEGDALDVIMGRYSRGEPNFGVLLHGYTGESVSVVRRGRDPDRLAAPRLTMALAVQPQAIEGLTASRVARGRGFLARILFSRPDSMLGSRELDTPPLNAEALSWWRGRIREFLAVEPPDSPRVLTLEPEAASLLRSFREDNERELGPGGRFEHRRDWAAKLPGQIVRIAGVLHLLEHGFGCPSTIGPSTMLAAMSWAPYLEAHELVSTRILGVDPVHALAKDVLDLFRRNRRSALSRREIHQVLKGRACVRSVEDLVPALDLLVELGWIRQVEEPGPEGRGRPRGPSYEIRPDAYSNPQYPQNSDGGSP